MTQALSCFPRAYLALICPALRFTEIVDRLFGEGETDIYTTTKEELERSAAMWLPKAPLAAAAVAVGTGGPAGGASLGNGGRNAAASGAVRKADDDGDDDMFAEDDAAAAAVSAPKPNVVAAEAAGHPSAAAASITPMDPGLQEQRHVSTCIPQGTSRLIMECPVSRIALTACHLIPPWTFTLSVFDKLPISLPLVLIL